VEVCHNPLKTMEKESEENNTNQGSSSLQDQLKSRLKKGLKPTSTKFISLDGSVTVLQNQGSELLDTKQPQSQQKTFGFVVDTKPDLSIGEVRPWLFLGSQDVPNDFDLVSKHGITHILSLLPDFELVDSVKLIVESHLSLEVYDEVGFDLLNSSVVLKALEFIHQCNLLKQEGKHILVHCNAGISRAPSIIISYLMKYEKLNFDQAFKEVQKVRPHAKPNDGFMRQLKMT